MGNVIDYSQTGLETDIFYGIHKFAKTDPTELFEESAVTALDFGYNGSNDNGLVSLAYTETTSSPDKIKLRVLKNVLGKTIDTGDSIEIDDTFASREVLTIPISTTSSAVIYLNGSRNLVMKVVSNLDGTPTVGSSFTIETLGTGYQLDWIDGAKTSTGRLFLAYYASDGSTAKPRWNAVTIDDAETSPSIGDTLGGSNVTPQGLTGAVALHSDDVAMIAYTSSMTDSVTPSGLNYVRVSGISTNSLSAGTPQGGSGNFVSIAAIDDDTLRCYEQYMSQGYIAETKITGILSGTLSKTTIAPTIGLQDGSNNYGMTKCSHIQGNYVFGAFRTNSNESIMFSGNDEYLQGASNPQPNLNGYVANSRLSATARISDNLALLIYRNGVSNKLYAVRAQ